MGINRNIVECKFLSFLSLLAEGMGINRNIVECKFINPFCLEKNFSVLIETLWNVNISL